MLCLFWQKCLTQVGCEFSPLVPVQGQTGLPWCFVPWVLLANEEVL